MVHGTIGDIKVEKGDETKICSNFGMHGVKVLGCFKEIKAYKEGRWKNVSISVTKHIK